MNDPESIRKIVRRGICLGYPPSQIFNEVFGTSNKYVGVSSYSSIVDVWFRNDEEKKKSVPEGFRPILQIMQEEFQKSEEKMKKRRCPKEVHFCQLSFLNKRYSMDMMLSNKRKCYSLFLVDNLYGFKRELKSNDVPLSFDHRLRLHTIDAEHFLLIHPSLQDAIPSVTVHLFQLNIDKMEYTKLDTIILHGHLFQLIFDSLDPRTFLICVQHSGKIRLFRCCLKDGKLLVDLNWLTYEFDPYAEMPSLKLENNFLYALNIVEQNDKISVIFNKLTLNQNTIECTKFCDITTNIELELHEFRGIRFSWSGNTCYGIKYASDGNTLIFSFDLDKQTMVRIEYRDIGTFRDVIVQDGVIFVCTVNDDTPLHAWHRIPISKPAPLSHLTQDAVHFHTLFLSDEDFNSWLERMPKCFHPFEGIDSTIQPKTKWVPLSTSNPVRN